MKLNKDVISRYIDFLKESLDPNKVRKTIRSFNTLPDDKINIPSELKDLSVDITELLKDEPIPFKKLIQVLGIEIELSILKSNRYYSSVDWSRFLNGDYILVIEVPENFDLNYLVSLIIHEVRHMVDFSDENQSSNSFKMNIKLNKYFQNINIFAELIYISLEHELVARSNQIYPYIKFKGLTKEESFSILKKSFIWEALEKLKTFKGDDFVKGYDENYLIDITNSFIKDILFDYDTVIENKTELMKFYSLFEEYFNEIYKKWISILKSEFEKIYERKLYGVNLEDSYVLYMKGFQKIYKDKIK
jgi:hypothetical protein